MKELIVGVAPLFIIMFIVAFFIISLMVILKVIFYLLDRWF